MKKVLQNIVNDKDKEKNLDIFFDNYGRYPEAKDFKMFSLDNFANYVLLAELLRNTDKELKFETEELHLHINSKHGNHIRFGDSEVFKDDTFHRDFDMGLKEYASDIIDILENNSVISKASVEFHNLEFYLMYAEKRGKSIHEIVAHLKGHAFAECMSILEDRYKMEEVENFLRDFSWDRSFHPENIKNLEVLSL